MIGIEKFRWKVLGTEKGLKCRFESSAESLGTNLKDMVFYLVERIKLQLEDKKPDMVLEIV